MATTTKLVKGVTEPQEYCEPKQDRWLNMQQALGGAKLPDDVRKALVRVTKDFVADSTSFKLIGSADARRALEKWVSQTGALKRKIWEKSKGAAAVEKVKVKNLLDVEAFNLRNELKKEGGRRRQTLAIAAAGLNLALETCRYAIQEIDGGKRSVLPSFAWNLWVARVVAILESRALVGRLKSGRYKDDPRVNAFIDQMQQTLPIKCQKYAVGPQLKREIGLSREWADGASPADLRLARRILAGNDRTRKTSKNSIQQLIDRARHMYKRKSHRTAR